MSAGNTPKPPKNGGTVLPFEKPRRERGDQTVSFETGTGKSHSKREIVITDDSPQDDRDTMEIPQPTELRSAQRLPNLPKREFSPGQTIVSFDESVCETYIIFEGRASVYGLNHDGELTDEVMYTLTEGELINAPLLTDRGRYGSESEFLIRAKTIVKVFVLSLDDLFDDRIDAIERRARLHYLVNALAELPSQVMTQKVRENQTEALYSNAIDRERETLQAERDELREARGEIEALRKKNAELEKLNKQITRDAVSDVLVRRLNELETELRDLRRNALERRVEVISAQSIIEMLREELEKAEKRSSASGMMQMKSEDLISILTDIYLAMFQSEDEKLTRLAFKGMNELHMLREKLKF